MNGNFANRMLTGLVIISLGVAFLLKQMGYVSFSIGAIFSTFWPCILIYLGLTQMIGSKSNGYGGFNWWGGMMIVIGAIFLGNNLGLTTWSIKDFAPFIAPIVVIFVGLRMIWKPRSRQQNPPTDDWKSYRPFSNDLSVPPAPPLHPDPTELNQEKDSRYGKDYSEPSREQSRNKYAGNAYEDQSINDEAEKKRRSGHRNEFHKEHVEWWDNDSVINRSSFIGDIHMGHDYWELKPLQISHFIGDTILDLTKAQIPFGETKINISSFIGDVKVYVPNDYEIGVEVVSSAFIGDVKVLGRKEGGMFTHVNTKSPAYMEADKKIKLIVSTFIGDTRVTKVG